MSAATKAVLLACCVTTEGDVAERHLTHFWLCSVASKPHRAKKQISSTQCDRYALRLASRRLMRCIPAAKYPTPQTAAGAVKSRHAGPVLEMSRLCRSKVLLIFEKNRSSSRMQPHYLPKTDRPASFHAMVGYFY